VNGNVKWIIGLMAIMIPVLIAGVLYLAETRAIANSAKDGTISIEKRLDRIETKLDHALEVGR